MTGALLDPNFYVAHPRKSWGNWDLLAVFNFNETARNHPWLVSTDQQVRQGAAEIEDCRWDQASSTLVIRATRPKGDRGSLFLRAPSGWALAEPQGLFIAKEGNDGSLIVRKAVEFGDARIEVRVGFQRIAK